MKTVRIEKDSELEDLEYFIAHATRLTLLRCESHEFKELLAIKTILSAIQLGIAEYQKRHQ